MGPVGVSTATIPGGSQLFARTGKDRVTPGFPTTRPFPGLESARPPPPLIPRPSRDAAGTLRSPPPLAPRCGPRMLPGERIEEMGAARGALGGQLFCSLGSAQAQLECPLLPGARSEVFQPRPQGGGTAGPALSVLQPGAAQGRAIQRRSFIQHLLSIYFVPLQL